MTMRSPQAHMRPTSQLRTTFAGSTIARKLRYATRWHIQFKDDAREEMERLVERAAEMDRAKARLEKAEARFDEQSSLANLVELHDALEQARAAVHKMERDFCNNPVRVSLLQPAFTRRREVFVGRIAMVGFVLACFWEVVLSSHPDILQQVLLATGWDPAVAAMGFLVLGICNAFAALAPWSPTWTLRNLVDVMRHSPDTPWYAVNPLEHPLEFLGLDPGTWGFTPANELFHGRLAMLGFVGSVVNEFRKGLDPFEQVGDFGLLAQLAGYLGLEANDRYYHVIGHTFIIFAVMATLIAYAFGNPGSGEVEEEV